MSPMAEASGHTLAATLGHRRVSVASPRPPALGEILRRTPVSHGASTPATAGNLSPRHSLGTPALRTLPTVPPLPTSAPHALGVAPAGAQSPPVPPPGFHAAAAGSSPVSARSPAVGIGSPPVPARSRALSIGSPPVPGMASTPVPGVTSPVLGVSSTTVIGSPPVPAMSSTAIIGSPPAPRAFSTTVIAPGVPPAVASWRNNLGPHSSRRGSFTLTITPVSAASGGARLHGSAAHLSSAPGSLVVPPFANKNTVQRGGGSVCLYPLGDPLGLQAATGHAPLLCESMPSTSLVEHLVVRTPAPLSNLVQPVLDSRAGSPVNNGGIVRTSSIDIPDTFASDEDDEPINEVCGSGSVDSLSCTQPDPEWGFTANTQCDIVNRVMIETVETVAQQFAMSRTLQSSDDASEDFEAPDEEEPPEQWSLAADARDTFLERNSEDLSTSCYHAHGQQQRHGNCLTTAVAGQSSVASPMGRRSASSCMAGDLAALSGGSPSRRSSPNKQRPPAPGVVQRPSASAPRIRRPQQSSVTIPATTQEPTGGASGSSTPSSTDSPRGHTRTRNGSMSSRVPGHAFAAFSSYVPSVSQPSAPQAKQGFANTRYGTPISCAATPVSPRARKSSARKLSGTPSTPLPPHQLPIGSPRRSRRDASDKQSQVQGQHQTHVVLQGLANNDAPPDCSPMRRGASSPRGASPTRSPSPSLKGRLSAAMMAIEHGLAPGATDKWQALQAFHEGVPRYCVRVERIDRVTQPMCYNAFLDRVAETTSATVEECEIGFYAPVSVSEVSRLSECGFCEADFEELPGLGFGVPIASSASMAHQRAYGSLTSSEENQRCMCVVLCAPSLLSSYASTAGSCSSPRGEKKLWTCRSQERCIVDTTQVMITHVIWYHQLVDDNPRQERTVAPVANDFDRRQTVLDRRHRQVWNQRDYTNVRDPLIKVALQGLEHIAAGTMSTVLLDSTSVEAESVVSLYLLGGGGARSQKCPGVDPREALGGVVVQRIENRPLYEQYSALSLTPEGSAPTPRSGDKGSAPVLRYREDVVWHGTRLKRNDGDGASLVTKLQSIAENGFDPQRCVKGAAAEGGIWVAMTPLASFGHGYDGLVAFILCLAKTHFNEWVDTTSARVLQRQRVLPLYSLVHA